MIKGDIYVGGGEAVAEDCLSANLELVGVEGSGQVSEAVSDALKIGMGGSQDVRLLDNLVVTEGYAAGVR